VMALRGVSLGVIRRGMSWFSVIELLMNRLGIVREIISEKQKMRKLEMLNVAQLLAV
jgi:hypothetical protein